MNGYSIGPIGYDTITLARHYAMNHSLLNNECIVIRFNDVPIECWINGRWSASHFNPTRHMLDVYGL